MGGKPSEKLADFFIKDTNIVSAHYHYNFGLQKAERGRYKTAIAYYNKAIALDPGDSLSYFHRGIAHLKLGNYEQALMNLKSAASLGHLEAKNLLLEMGGKDSIESLLQNIERLPQTETIYNKTCSVCNKIFPTHNAKRKICSFKCRQRLKQSLRTETIYSKVCPVCEKGFKTNSPRKIFCSSECRKWDQYSKPKKSAQPKKYSKICIICKKEFQTNSSGKVFCSSACQLGLARPRREQSS